MKIPKILVDGHILDGQPQGTTTYLSGLYKAIAELNLAEVYIACCYKESIDKHNLSHKNIRWIKLSTKNKFKRLLFSLPYLEYKLKPDFTHYNYIAPILKFSKRIVTCHDLLFLDFPKYFSFKYRFQRKLLFYISSKTSEIVSTVSNYSASSISKHFSVPLDRILIAPNAIDEGKNLEEIKINKEIYPSKFFIYVSRFEPRKNQHLLIKAFKKFCENNDKDYKLILVGYPDLDYPELTRELINSETNRVLVLSNISRNELNWLYKNSVASIYPSHGEGFGIPPIEAIAAGGRSYCSNNSALTELAEYVNGTFDSYNIEDIEKTLKEATKEIDSDYQANLREAVINTFSWKKTAKKFVSSL